MRNCIDEGTLQAWIDGALAASETANVAAHLHECVQCAEAARAAEAENLILFEGLSAEFAAAIPSERLRQLVNAAVAELHHAKVPVVRESRWHAITQVFASFRPLAYASIAAIVLLAGFVAFVYLQKEKSVPIAAQNNPPILIPVAKETPVQGTAPVPTKSPQIVSVHKTKAPIRSKSSEPDAKSLSWQEQQYEYAIARLNEAIKIQPPMRPSLRVEYEYNMALVDNAIAIGRDVARKNPRDPLATQSMLAAYQSKVDLMNQIADARTLER